MRDYRINAIIAGSLFITATMATVISQTILGPMFDAPDFLANVVDYRNLLVLGVLLELTNALACAGIAISLFSVLRIHNEGIAVGYVGFRTIEAAIAIIASISFLSIFTLGQQYAAAGAPAESDYQNLGSVLLANHDWAYLMMLIVFCLGALIFYFLLFQSKLVPRVLSAWGLIGASLALAASMLDIFGVIKDGSTISNFLYLPIALNELALAAWLIFKGFNRDALAAST